MSAALKDDSTDRVAFSDLEKSLCRADFAKIESDLKQSSEHVEGRLVCTVEFVKGSNGLTSN